MNGGLVAGAEHMWVRHRVTLAEANEALADAARILLDPDPKSKSGDSMRVNGYSPTCRAILTVILVRDPEATWLCGANAWPSNSADRRLYHEGSG